MPDDVHRTYRRRAAAAGMSLQEYLLGELVDGARVLTPAEVVEEVAQHIARGAGDGFSGTSSVQFIRRDRDGR